MRVEQIGIQKFRGVEATSLTNCGDLNVLIGQNNSGKSTILDAIDKFFGVMAAQSVVAGVRRNGEPLGLDLDFHRRNAASAPIKISVEFSLTPEELKEITDEIAKEAPQMKHALERVPTTGSLLVEVTSMRQVRPFAFVSRIELVGDTVPNRTLLSVTSDAALEMLKRDQEVSRAERRVSEATELGIRIDPEDFTMLRDRGMSLASHPVSRRLRLDADFSYEIDNVLRHSESYADFRQQLESLASSAGSEASRVLKDPLSNTVDTFSGEAQVIPAYAMSILQRIGRIKLLHLRDRREPVGRSEAQQLLALKTRRKGPEVLRNIQDTVYSLLGVSIDAFESEEPLPRGESRAEMDVDEILVEMNGAGIREALRLILDNELGAPQLLLVEEPEIHLHPALEVSMLRYLKSASTRAQIFVTTHSTNFLDTSDMRNVYLTRRNPWVSVSLLDYEQAENAIPEELGIRLSSLFMYDRLVFVEGPSDEAIIREIAPMVGVNLGHSNVGFVLMGSARNFTHYAGGSTIGLLTKRRVSMTFVLDRDEASSEEAVALRERLSGVADVHVLQKREIENYLALPRPLAEFIREKGRMQNREIDVTEAMVREMLETCAEELRTLAVRKRVVRRLCGPVFLDRAAMLNDDCGEEFSSRVVSEIRKRVIALEKRVEDVEEAIETEGRQVADRWDADKLDIVSGDELIDAVCQRFDVRFKKQRDGVRLAGLFREEELDQELIDLVKELG